MSIVSYMPKRGGININGIIQDYYAYAGENISAGDFVEYINGVASTTTKSGFSSSIISSEDDSYRYSATLLDESRVFVAHNFCANSSNQNYLYAVVCTISNGSLSKGTTVTLSTTNRSGYMSTVSKLQDGRVLIAHTSTTNWDLYGAICSINGTSITLDCDIGLGKTINTYAKLRSISWGSNEVLITYDGIKGMVCSVSSTTITQGTEITLVKSANYHQELILLPSGYIFMPHSGSSSYAYLYGALLSVSGTTVSAVRTSAINSSLRGSGIGLGATVLDNTRVFISHSDSDNGTIYGIICTISGTTITKGTDTQLATEINSSSGNGTQSVLLGDGRVLVYHSLGDSSCLYGLGCVVSGTTITSSATSKLNSTADTGSMLRGFPFQGNGLIFHAYGAADNLLRASIYNLDSNNVPTRNILVPTFETQVRPTTTSQFDGIAKTGGTGGTNTAHNQQVSIYTLEGGVA